MKKILRIIAAIAMTTILFTGCGENQATEIGTQATETVPEFTLIKIPVQSTNFNSTHCSFYKDPVTDVMYINFKGWTSGGLVWMPDPDTGLPLKYDRFFELYEEYIPTEELQTENKSEIEN